MKSEPRINLLLVDDHPIVRAGFHMVEQIDPRMRVVGEASTVEDGWKLAQRLQPDLVLLDVRLPDGDGIELCRRIKETWPEMRVLCLTSYSDDHLVLGAMEAGAEGYLLKQNDANQIVEAVQTVMRGGVVFDAAVSAAAHGASAQNPLESLSPGELRVLAEVAKGRTDKEASVALSLSVKTVRNYLDRVFTKLGVHTRTEAALVYAAHRVDPEWREG
jgi:two-component system response regulator DevR